MATVYISGSFFMLAKKAYERSLNDKTESTVALILSAMGVEAFINELAERACNSTLIELEPNEVKVLGDVLNDLEEQKAQVGAKIQLAYFILKRERLKIGELSYQDFALLISIRNALVHKKPEKFDMAPFLDSKEYEPHKFIKRLAERKVISLPPSVQPPQWYVYINEPEVARWSYNVAVEIVKFLVELFPLGQFKGILSFSVEHTKEIP